jgi:hypothetical protein
VTLPLEAYVLARSSDGRAATPVADSLAGRWVVPGLAAVGASTLAALGLWLGYQRRHLAGLSR